MIERVRSRWRLLPPSGPAISILLIELVLLNALLYYRSVKIQRFLEPALALSQPRNEFTKRINELFRQEFGDLSASGLMVRRSSIQMRRSLIFKPDGRLKPEGRSILGKLARVFFALMKDERTRSEINRILIVARFAHREAPGANVPARMQEHLLVGFIQDALFLEVPELGRGYASYFISATEPSDAREKATDVVEFIIVPSESLHIEVLEKLEKYAE